MGTSGQQVSVPLRAGAPRTDWINYSADQIEQWALATQPEKVSAAGEAYWQVSSTFRNSISVLHETAQMLAGAWKGQNVDAALAQMSQMVRAADQVSSAMSTAGSMLKAHGDDNLSYFKWYFGAGTWWAWKKAQVSSSLAASATNPTVAAKAQQAAAALQKEAQRQLTLHNRHISETYSGIPANADVSLPPGGGRGDRPALPDSSGSAGSGGGWSSGSAAGGGSLSGTRPHAPRLGASNLPNAPLAPHGGTHLASAPPIGSGNGTPMPSSPSAPNPSGPGGMGGRFGLGGIPLPGGMGGGDFSLGGAGRGIGLDVGPLEDSGRALFGTDANGLQPGQVIGEQQAKPAVEGESALIAEASQGGGMVPMGMGPGAAGGEQAHQTAGYLPEDPETWSTGSEGVPAIIGGAQKPEAPAHELDEHHKGRPAEEEKFELRRIRELAEADELIDLQALNELGQ